MEKISGGLAPLPELRRPNWHRVVRDLKEGIVQWRLWAALGLQDVRLRYRRTVLGPFWVTITTGIMVVCLGFLWGVLFRQDLTEFFPYLAAGYIVWQTIGLSISDSCTVFTEAGDIINARKVPLSIFPLRFAFRHLIQFFHNIVVYVGVLLVFPVPLNANFLWAIPGLLVVFLNILWVSTAFGMVGARFRDIQPVVSSLVAVLFFMTPVFWKREMLQDRAIVADLNPFTHYVEIMRAPLLGQPPQLLSWLVVAAITLAGWALAILVFYRTRGRVVYWV